MTREKIESFGYIQLHYSNPFGGAKTVRIDSTGTLVVKSSPYVVVSGAKKKDATPAVKLTKEEYSNFMNVLSRSLISKLPEDRGCGIDQPTTNFDISINGRIIKSQGCDLSWIHSQLQGYLLALADKKIN